MFSSNADALIADFPSELAKETVSSGSFREDYEKITVSFGIIPCPFVKISDDKVSCKVLNCEIDLCNWRAMLLAVAAANSEVKELIIHGCSLTLQHVQDLETTLEKIGTIHTLKMDFTTIAASKVTSSGDEGAEGGECPLPSSSEFWAPLLSGSIMVPYISLKGCSIDDECIKESSALLTENITLRALNLSDNPLTSEGAAVLFKILPLMNCLEHLIIKQSQISGDVVQVLANIIVGRELLEEDDTVLKEVAKKVVEKNKTLKDLNKKRKGKYPDLTDLHTATDRTTKIGETSILLHRSLATLDLSYNPIVSDSDCLQELVKILMDKTSEISEAGLAACGTRITLLGGQQDEALSALSHKYGVGDQVNGKLILKLTEEVLDAAAEGMGTEEPKPADC